MYKKVLIILLLYLNLEGIKIYSQLTVDDQKKIDKADELIILADKLVEEANQLYLETFKIKSDIKLSESEINKKCKKLENEANKKQLKANELYYKAYDTKTGIYKLYLAKYIEKKINNEETEYLKIKIEEINEYLIKANEYETKAAKIKDDKEKILLLNKAREERLKAYEIAEQAYKFINKENSTVKNELPETYDNLNNKIIATSESHSLENDKFKEIRINEVLLQSFQKYVGDSINNMEFLTPEKISELLTYSPEQLKDFWYRYYFVLPASDEKNISSEKIDKIADRNEKGELTNIDVVNKNNTENNAIRYDQIPQIEKDDKSLEKNKRYRIQIYAGKNSLDQNALRKIYYGNKNLEYIYEDGLYKYSIGDFDSYKDAEKFRKEAGLQNAVILEYTEDKQFLNVPVTQQIEKNFKKQQENQLYSDFDDKIIFKVQIAASRFHITLRQLNQFYNSPYTIEEIFEEDWYKYQTIGTSSFNKALQILKNVTVKGVFISAYQNNKKISLHDAIKQTKNIKEPYFEFHVQILASRNYLKMSELSEFYNGSYPISIFYEDNLYKYRINAGSSYERALEIKENCNVKDAFIVVYEDGIKIPLYKYLNIKKQ